MEVTHCPRKKSAVNYGRILYYFNNFEMSHFIELFNGNVFISTSIKFLACLSVVEPLIVFCERKKKVN